MSTPIDASTTIDANDANATESRESRRALICFVALVVLALPLLLSWGRNGWFNVDDWDFLAARTLGNVGDLMRPHYGHWTTLPIVAYRVLWSFVGLRSYVPYLALAVIAHLGVAALLRIVMRRAGVGPWLSTLVAGIFVFFGSGAENILLAFQVTFVGALAFGLVQLILADHDGPFGTRDWLALLAGFAGLMCSGIELILMVAVGLVVLSRRGWRRAAFHTVPLAVIYLIWSVAAPEGQSTAKWRATSPASVFEFVGVGIKTAFVRTSRISAVGLVLAVLMVLGLVLVYKAQGLRMFRGPTTAPLALLLGAVLFLFMTGALRSGSGGVLADLPGSGPDRAHLGRYVYIVTALSLPALAVALEAVIRRWRHAAIVVVAVLVIGIPGNVRHFSVFVDRATDIQNVKTNLLASVASPLAPELPRTLQPEPYFAGQVTLGWMLDNKRGGRLPSLAFLTESDIRAASMRLALQPTDSGSTASCLTLHRPTVIVVQKGATLTAKNGAVVIYLQVFRPSETRVLPESTSVEALAGPLRLVLTSPPPSAERTRGAICSNRRIVPRRINIPVPRTRNP